MENIAIGTKVEAYTSQCIGMVIDSVTRYGKIVKVNAKSIVVEFDDVVVKHGRQVVREFHCGGKATFRFWKTLSDGRMAYKNQLNGIIKL